MRWLSAPDERADYLPLLILPIAGLVILIAAWIIIASDKRNGGDHHRHPAE